jgi:hypothetical protein
MDQLIDVRFVIVNVNALTIDHLMLSDRSSSQAVYAC